MSKFLKFCNLDLDSLLRLSQQELSNLIIRYLVSLKISSQYKAVILASIKHACEMKDVILNQKKLGMFQNVTQPNPILILQWFRRQIIQVGFLSRQRMNLLINVFIIVCFQTIKQVLVRFTQYPISIRQNNHLHLSENTISKYQGKIGNEFHTKDIEAPIGKGREYNPDVVIPFSSKSMVQIQHGVAQHLVQW